MEVDEPQPSTSKSFEQKVDCNLNDRVAVENTDTDTLLLRNSLQGVFARISSNKGIKPEKKLFV